MSFAIDNEMIVWQVTSYPTTAAINGEDVVGFAWTQSGTQITNVALEYETFVGNGSS